MMNEESDMIVALLKSFSPHDVCANMLNVCDKTPLPPPSYEGPARILSNLSNFEGEPRWPNWPTNGGKLTGTFVHITDLHLQLDYAEGMNTDCGQPICCRKEAGEGPVGKQANKFGDWNCDLSPALADSMFKAIGALEVVPDFLINTGDDPAHDVWTQTHSQNLNAVTHVRDSTFNMSFGPNIPVVNALGNHANTPVNQYEGPGGDDWLYQGAAGVWDHWLSDDAARTMAFGGYYTMRVAPKLRAVVMHSTMFASGSSGSWFFTVNRSDIGAQFPWLYDALRQARERGEKVLLIRHCPISDFDLGFSDLIRDITENFNDIIVASFSGHSHTSWFTVQRDRATDTKPLDVTYISGSGTPGGGNPTFRVFHYDLETFELLDYDQYWVDMDKAIATGEAVWTKDHSAKEYLGLSDLSAQSWEGLAKSWLSGNDTMQSWQNYARAMTRARDPPSSQDRKTEACTALSVSLAMFKICMEDNEVCLATHDSPTGSSLPIELARVFVQSLIESRGG